MFVAFGEAGVPISSGFKLSNHCIRLLTAVGTIPPISKPTTESILPTSIPFTSPSTFWTVNVPTLLILFAAASRVPPKDGDVSLDNLESIVTSVPPPVVRTPPAPRNLANPVLPIGVRLPASVVTWILTIPEEVIVIWLASELK